MKSLEEKVGQMLVVGFHGLQAPDYILDWLKAGKIGGVILFARNIDNPSRSLRCVNLFMKLQNTQL